MRMHSKSCKTFVLYPAVILIIAFLASCAITRPICLYDEVTDQSLAAIRQQTDNFIFTLKDEVGTGAAAFQMHQDFYTSIDDKLHRLESRVNSMPNNDKTISLVQKIRQTILGEDKCSAEGSSLRDLHCMPHNRDKGPSKIALDIAMRNIDQTIFAAMTIETAKKHEAMQSRK